MQIPAQISAHVCAILLFFFVKGQSTRDVFVAETTGPRPFSVRKWAKARGQFPLDGVSKLDIKGKNTDDTMSAGCFVNESDLCFATNLQCEDIAQGAYFVTGSSMRRHFNVFVNNVSASFLIYCIIFILVKGFRVHQVMNKNLSTNHIRSNFLFSSNSLW